MASSDYLVSNTDANPPQEPYPATFTNSKITPLIDCSNYASELINALALVGTGADATANAGHFIYIANWWLNLSGGQYTQTTAKLFGLLSDPGGTVTADVNGPPFHLDAAGGTNALIDVLHAKAAVGVEVRVLGWVSFALMSSVVAQQSGGGDIAAINGLTMKSIKDLRDDPNIGANAVLNVIAHTAGAAHTKLVVIGTSTQAIGFTGGIDFREDRWGHPEHNTAAAFPPAPLPQDIWHDVVAKVEGPAVQGLYDWFKNLYDENLSRPVKRFHFAGQSMPSFLPGTTPVPAKGMPTTTAGNMQVQSLRTVSMFNYTWTNCLPENPPIKFGDGSTSQGIFEFKEAIKKAIANATSYIYIEDQSFWSYDIMSWINQAVVNQPTLNVILLTSGASDPNDPNFPAAYVCNAINHGLLNGLTATQIARIGYFRRMQSFTDESPVTVTSTAPDTIAGRTQATTDAVATANMAANELSGDNLYLRGGGGNLFPVTGNLAAAPGTNLVLIVDSLPGPTAITAGPFTQTQAVGITVHAKTTIIDDTWACIGSANCMRRSLFTDLEYSVGYIDLDNVAVKEYRKNLWADHFRHAAADFDDIESALWSWNSLWGAMGTSPARPDEIVQAVIPIVPDEILQGKNLSKYDWFVDVNSQAAWGGLCPP
jgi:phosphatidylserine/phosphatidylglycerophosphate/cardiolipin synthase-like enzyme